MDKQLNQFRRLAKRLFQADDNQCHVSHRLSDAFDEASKRLNLGFESEGLIFSDEDGDKCGAIYLNLGDTYDRTVIAEYGAWGGVRWTLGSWGDLVERREQQGYVTF